MPTALPDCDPTTSANLDIRQIICDVLGGDREAYRLIVDAYAQAIVAYLSRHISRRDSVDDLVQETFIAAFTSLAEFDLDSNFAVWLRGIARNKMHGYFRSTSRKLAAMGQYRRQLRDESADDGHERTSDQRDDEIAALQRCITRLPPRLQTVVRGGLEGSTPSDLAVTLGTSVHAVHTLNWRANQMLRAQLERELAASDAIDPDPKATSARSGRYPALTAKGATRQGEQPTAPG